MKLKYYLIISLIYFYAHIKINVETAKSKEIKPKSTTSSDDNLTTQTLSPTKKNSARSANKPTEKPVDSVKSTKPSQSKKKDGKSDSKNQVKTTIGSKTSDLEKRKFWEEYNRKIEDGYKKMFEDIEKRNATEHPIESTTVSTEEVKDDEDQLAGAFYTGDQDVGGFQGFMDGVPVLRNMLGKTCFPDIGCFSAMDYQDFSRRPIPVLPLSPAYLDIKLHLYTLEEKIKPTNLSYNATYFELKNTTFNPKLRTIVIIHGFRSGLEPWMEELKDLLFNGTDEEGQYNIFLVNWEKGAKVPMYHLAAANTRVVGALVAFFINSLVETFQSSNDMFSLVGHSLGAHTSGYVGKRLHSPKVARITGLDPAGPGFHFADPQMHLHPSDATHVEAIHTDCGSSFNEGLGSTDSFALIDFFPNGGISQPGCPLTKGIVNLVTAALSGVAISCSHTRAYEFVANFGKDNDECYPMAYQCDHWETFLEGRCAGCGSDGLGCRLMGLYPKYYRGIKISRKTIGQKYFVNTAGDINFCVHHYQIAIHINGDSDTSSGYMQFSFSANNKIYNIERVMSKITPGSIHTALLTTDSVLNELIEFKISWKRFKEGDRIQKGNKMNVNYIEINYMSHIDDKEIDEKSSVLCPKNSAEVRVSDDGQELVWFEFVKCSDTKPKESARNMWSEKLKPLTVREDIIYIDIDNKEPINLKLVKTNFPKINNGSLFKPTTNAVVVSSSPAPKLKVVVSSTPAPKLNFLKSALG